ncbi:MAG: YtpI family protein [Bacillus sp. (in: firmicutes)]
MPVFAALIIVSLAFYVFFKIKFFRTKRPIEKKWVSSKSSIALGTFVSLFGLNQLFMFKTILTYIIASIFIIIGTASIWAGIKAYKFFLPLAIDEAEQMDNQA